MTAPVVDSITRLHAYLARSPLLSYEDNFRGHGSRGLITPTRDGGVVMTAHGAYLRALASLTDPWRLALVAAPMTEDVQLAYVLPEAMRALYGLNVDRRSMAATQNALNNLRGSRGSRGSRMPQRPRPPAPTRDNEEALLRIQLDRSLGGGQRLFSYALTPMTVRMQRSVQALERSLGMTPTIAHIFARAYYEDILEAYTLRVEAYAHVPPPRTLWRRETLGRDQNTLDRALLMATRAAVKSLGDTRTYSDAERLMRYPMTQDAAFLVLAERGHQTIMHTLSAHEQHLLHASAACDSLAEAAGRATPELVSDADVVTPQTERLDYAALVRHSDLLDVPPNGVRMTRHRGTTRLEQANIYGTAADQAAYGGPIRLVAGAPQLRATAHYLHLPRRRLLVSDVRLFRTRQQARCAFCLRLMPEGGAQGGPALAFQTLVTQQRMSDAYPAFHHALVRISGFALPPRVRKTHLADQHGVLLRVAAREEITRLPSDLAYQDVYSRQALLSGVYPARLLFSEPNVLISICLKHVEEFHRWVDSTAVTRMPAQDWQRYNAREVERRRRRLPCDPVFDLRAYLALLPKAQRALIAPGWHTRQGAFWPEMSTLRGDGWIHAAGLSYDEASMPVTYPWTVGAQMSEALHRASVLESLDALTTPWNAYGGLRSARPQFHEEHRHGFLRTDALTLNTEANEVATLDGASLLDRFDLSRYYYCPAHDDQ